MGDSTTKVDQFVITGKYDKSEPISADHTKCDRYNSKSKQVVKPMKEDKIIDFRHEWMMRQDERDDERNWKAMDEAIEELKKDKQTPDAKTTAPKDETT